MERASARRLLAWVSATGLVASVGAVVPAAMAPGAAAVAAGDGGVAPQVVVGHRFAGSTPPSFKYCITNYGIACYGPHDMQAQYDFTGAYAAGFDGKGQTIVIFDSFGSPTIAKDLATFDSQYQLPAPPSLQVYQPEGHVTYGYLGASPSAVAANKNLQTQIGWGYETTLDVEYAHAMAPGAAIALVETPNAETQGVQGLQNLQNAQQWVLDHHIGTIWSNSWATTEQAFHSPSAIQQLNRFYATAAADGVSAFFATGDSGVYNGDKQGNTYPYPTVNFPSSSPDVVSVGGTEIPVPQPAIFSYNPEAVWNDCCGAGGGGFSSVFGEPSYQSASAIPDRSGARGIPDVSYNAALISSILIYESFDPAGSGWLPIGGTSAAAPQWAAVDAVANQADGPLGFLTPRLYAIYRDKAAYDLAFHDITAGDNSAGGVTGYSAQPGWDAATGLGTPDVANLVKALSAAS